MVKYALYGLLFSSQYFSHYRKTPQIPPFLFLWRICPIIALFAKIRQIYTSKNGHYSPLNRGCFCHLVYPIQTPERLPEYDYEGHFSDGGLKNGVWAVE